ncbi:MAG: YkgJ family cysteine cluster protein [Proteobacteria bacterium]|nr:YkgJ family cysteine cluster protein [Pseudomonadota bacterium]
MAQDQFNQMVFDVARSQSAAHLTPEPAIPALLRLVQDAVSLSNDLLAEIAERDISDITEIACEIGCAWCCYQQVGVTAPQALHIADYLQRGDAKIPADAALERLEELDDITNGMSNVERLKIRRPCALLDEQGACLIYAVRPLACRGCNSMDAEICRRTVEDFEAITEEWRDRSAPPWIHRLPYEAMAMIQDGVLAATVDAGFREDKLELTAALRIALEDPDAGSKWLSGDPVFETARLPRLQSVWDDISEG